MKSMWNSHLALEVTGTYIYMMAVTLRLCQFMVGSERARVDTFVGRAKIHTIPQNDGDPVTIILSNSMHFCAASMVRHACHFTPHRAWRLIRSEGPELGENAWKLTVYDPIM